MYRVSLELTRASGGWNKESAMENYYISCASREAACATAGFRGLEDYRPPHKHAEPSDLLIKVVFGAVLTVRNAVTGEDDELDVDQAIHACKEHDHSTGGKGVSAAPLFEVLSLLAKALLQVHPFSYPSPVRSLAKLAQSHDHDDHAWLQALPKLRELWPSHWIFHRHPLFQLPPDHPTHKMYDAWEGFQTKVCDKVLAHYDGPLEAGETRASMGEFSPDARLSERATEVGPTVFARWNADDKLPNCAADPCLSMALSKVSSFLMYGLLRCKSHSIQHMAGGCDVSCPLLQMTQAAPEAPEADADGTFEELSLGRVDQSLGTAMGELQVQGRIM